MADHKILTSQQKSAIFTVKQLLLEGDTEVTKTPNVRFIKLNASKRAKKNNQAIKCDDVNEIGRSAQG